MKLNNLFFAFFLLFSISAIAQNYTFTDGPYIIENRVIGVVDKNGEQRVLDTLFTSYSNIAFNVATNNGKELFILDNSFIKSIDYSINSSELGKRSEQLIFTISDSHGDINQFINLLTRNKIINKDLDWSFAKNTLVINGDTFDRGSDVLPLLWYIIKLEQQAKVAGGRLVYVLGNHDNMVLKGDLRYLADKYRSLQDSLGQPYNALFCKESIIGKWLASKNAVQKIGNLLFVHGGISYEFVKMGLTPEIANKIIRYNLFC